MSLWLADRPPNAAVIHRPSRVLYINSRIFDPVRADPEFASGGVAMKRETWEKVNTPPIVLSVIHRDLEPNDLFMTRGADRYRGELIALLGH